MRAAIDKGIEVHLEEYLAELETLLRHRDMRGLYEHLKMTAGLGGRKTEGLQAIKDENSNLLRDKRDILRRWERFFGNLHNTKSPALQPSIVEKVQQRRKAPPPPPPGARSQIGEPISLEAEPTYAGTQKAVRAMANWKATGADSLPVKLLKLDDPTRVQELGRQRKIQLYMCFVDLQKAYDSADRELLWEVLARAGVPSVMIDVIRQFHDGMRARVRMDDGELSE